MHKKTHTKNLLINFFRIRMETDSRACPMICRRRQPRRPTRPARPPTPRAALHHTLLATASTVRSWSGRLHCEAVEQVLLVSILKQSLIS